MVAFRLLQGVFGAALVPLAQAVMLDIYPPEKRGSAMAIWGMGVMLGPIMGPTLGGWLTDSYSWRWVFFVNLPFGILTVLGLMRLHARDADAQDVPFSWFGFLTLSLGIGALQMMLDRGQDQGWFDSNEIIVEAILSVGRLLFLPRRRGDDQRPFIPLRMFRDWNFSIAIIFMFLIGIILLGDDGAGDAVHPEPDGLSRAGERLSARRARHRHVLRDDGGRPPARQGRRAHSDRASG